MSEQGLEPGGSLRDTIRGMNQQELCAFVAELCKIVKSEVGNNAYRGGIFPENISLAPAAVFGSVRASWPTGTGRSCSS